METTNEITALFNLLDDPDEEVFGLVSGKIINYGKSIIPNLEHLWETVPDETIQTRVEILIHRLYYNDLKEDFSQWAAAGQQDLASGAMLSCKFQYPEMSTTPVLQEIEKIRRNIWLELNNYLTPLEQIKIVTSILFSYYGLKGKETSYTTANEFLLNKTLDTKTGNQVSNGILYLLLCEQLDIPVKAIRIPKQFILGYFKHTHHDDGFFEEGNKIEFFIDPTAGHVFTQQDVDSYFKRIAVPQVPSYYKPLQNKQVIQMLLTELSKCFTTERDKHKKNELEELTALLD
ncbi:MAG: transglutaminase family protein [Chitinophagaceae bacterium]|nr:transglutaminase family protein [Chitinophagaceae bacterium]